MDQAVLVKSDRDIEAKVMLALNRMKIPVKLMEWNYVPQLEEWQLIIATPWFDTKGPLTIYRALAYALKTADNYVPMRRVFLRSPTDPLVKTLEREAKEHNRGVLHILGHRARNMPHYSVVLRSGYRVRSRELPDIEELRIFLTDDLGLRRSAVDDALDEVKRTDATSVFPVTLTTRQMNRLGFE
jgi:hypothetical protein